MIVGSDDIHLRVYNYNTAELVKNWEAHGDYIRSLAVHPTLPYVLSSADDMTIKLWDWDKVCFSRVIDLLYRDGPTHEFSKDMSTTLCP